MEKSNINTEAIAAKMEEMVVPTGAPWGEVCQWLLSSEGAPALAEMLQVGLRGYFASLPRNAWMTPFVTCKSLGVIKVTPMTLELAVRRSQFDKVDYHNEAVKVSLDETAREEVFVLGLDEELTERMALQKIDALGYELVSNAVGVRFGRTYKKRPTGYTVFGEGKCKGGKQYHLAMYFDEHGYFVLDVILVHEQNDPMYRKDSKFLVKRKQR